MCALRDLGEPLPAAALLFSPWVDLSDGHAAAGQRPSWEENAGVDYLEPKLAHMLADAWAGGRPLDDPWVSPLFCDLAGLPPLLVQVGDREVLRDQVKGTRVARYRRARQRHDRRTIGAR
jgi:acetyl esterase/lipase